MKPELLAPAGDLERLKWAFLYGADAVYVGGPAFGLRANANNFTFEELEEGLKYAHERGKHVHVTVNIVLHNIEVEKVLEYLKKLESLGVDAIIVSDPAIMELALKETKIPVHVSTQQSTLNKLSVAYFKEKGVSRVVLGREATKEDIEEIIKENDIEIETFIHGSMCASYSGRCVLSNFFTGRDANRGGCSQICRWDFALQDEKGTELKGEKPFTFCTKDLSLLKYLPEMIDIGIRSFKIEGRMRSIYYIATVVGTYRKAIDTYMHNKDKYQYNKDYERILVNCANRESAPQFFHGVDDETCQYYNGRVEVSNQDFLGVILGYDQEKKVATVEQRNYFKRGDITEIFGPNKESITYTVEEIWDENGEAIEVVRHPKQIVKLRIEEPVRKYDLIRTKRC
ncbi:MAG: U32 family peptidase [Bacilli bacterium]|nr:U32 family peptidase [Bacilli bacterium]